MQKLITNLDMVDMGNMGNMEKNVEAGKTSDVLALSVRETAALGEVNISGHRQELQRNFGLWSICGVGLVTGNSWAALGGSIVIELESRLDPASIHAASVPARLMWDRSWPYTTAAHRAPSTSCSSPLPPTPSMGRDVRADHGPASRYRSSTSSSRPPSPSWLRRCLHRAAVGPP